MNSQALYIAFLAIVRKEVGRFLRIWSQTLLPPVITTSLYFVVFGAFLGKQIANIHGVPYIQFIVPGLVMMSVLTSAYSNVSSSFFGAKFQRNLEELLVSPTPAWIVIAGYMVGGMLRGLIVGALVLGVSMFFTNLTLFSVVHIIAFIFLTSALFSMAGLVNAVYAKNFDAVSIVPTFVLTPLTYLGGIFYSVSLLPPFWQAVSHFNPILYMVNGFRYGFLGFADMPIWQSYAVLLGMFVLMSLWCGWLFATGRGLKS
ncbi:MAG: ABC transporter permease [Patescibacteria group bacterium]